MTHLRILHAEDQSEMAQLVDILLRANSKACNIELELSSVVTFADFQHIAFDQWDAIILDLSFPDSNSEETLTWIDANSAKCAAIIVVTGSERDADYHRALECGALRFIRKEEINCRPRHLLMNIYESVLTRRAILKHYGPTQKLP